MQPNAADASLLSSALETASAICGIGGTYLMARRYTTSLPVFLIFALIAPVLIVAGRLRAVRDYYEQRAAANQDVPVATHREALGLGLLCWAFFLQLAKIFVT